MSEETKAKIAASVRRSRWHQGDRELEVEEKTVVNAPSYRGTNVEADDPYLLGKKESGPRYRCRCGALSEPLTTAQLRGTPFTCAGCGRMSRVGGGRQ